MAGGVRFPGWEMLIRRGILWPTALALGSAPLPPQSPRTPLPDPPPPPRPTPLLRLPTPPRSPFLAPPPPAPHPSPPLGPPTPARGRYDAAFDGTYDAESMQKHAELVSRLHRLQPNLLIKYEDLVLLSPSTEQLALLSFPRIPPKESG